jgi:hypothetical protein
MTSACASSRHRCRPFGREGKYLSNTQARATIVSTVNTHRLPERAPPGTAPAVSVVVIFKDAQDFLAEAIDSVVAQTLTAWELLLVDDGSSDGSTAIARNRAGDNPSRVVYLEHAGHANLGMSASRNFGISHARGEFVAFLDADDALVPTALDEQVAILRAHPGVGMVYGPLEYWHGWTGTPEDVARDFIHPVGVATEQIYEPPSLIGLFLQNIAFAPSGRSAGSRRRSATSSRIRFSRRRSAERRRSTSRGAAGTATASIRLRAVSPRRARVNSTPPEPGSCDGSSATSSGRA